MAYHERPLKPRGRLHLDGDGFDIDSFGMDDGLDRDPDSTFRFLFQLGNGLMIYRYVLCAMQPGDDRWMHTFWTKDCAVAYVEEEEHGPPDAVLAERVPLPPPFRRFRLEGNDPPGARDFTVTELTFDAAYRNNAGRFLRIRFGLRDPAGGPATLTWSLADRWQLTEGDPHGLPRALTGAERVTFAEAL